MDIGHSGEKVLIGDSPRMRQIKRLTERLGRGRWPVLILGETGTGKEVAARAIYQSNPVGPFVTVDCSSMVGPLMESELFGHVKGAFTGAATNKVGLLELANGGTAFFDEIGELPLDLQAKLLRVLQEKEFRPVGSVMHRKSDFRILAATNRDLAKEVERGTFRRDLYYRLNVVNIRLAPLRERREDIPLLVEHFVKKYGGNYTLTPEALQVMMEYDWPGNVRELENCVQHMVALNTGPLLHSSDLPSPLQNFMMAKRNGTAAVAAGAGGSIEALPAAASTKKPVLQPEPPQTGVILPLMEVERRAILQAITYTKGDRVMAANLLGIGRTTLYRKLKEYQLTA
jgi:Response regulator containing CheY-like receiver, AAA-type ATPase, and DNA-binding domains